MEKKMAEKEKVTEAEIKTSPEAETPNAEVKPKKLLEIAEVRMVLYVIPVALAIWLFAYIYQHYIK
jgi:cell division protein FtsL